MTNKFNVGDKVVPITKRGAETFHSAVWNRAKEEGQKFIYINKIEDHIIICNEMITDEVSGDYFEHDDLKLYESKPTKNQRITALEETIAKQGEEIEELKLIVAQIRKPSTVVEEALAQAKSDFNNYKPMRYIGKIEVKKSANQQRAEIIEKAKYFIQYLKKKTHTFKAKQLNGTKITVQNVYIVPSHKNINNSDMRGVCNLEFVVNADKGVVVALLKGYHSKRLMSKGIAKCDPSDVFNEHIGKAIALGRALGLDVSEFEQAVQPNEVVDYMKIDTEKGIYTVTPGDEYEYGHGTGECQANSPLAKNCVIINDTNAIYETAVNE